MIYDEHQGTGRNAELYLVHKDYQTAQHSYDWFGDFGVDSGQAGVFDAASYRDDAYASGITTPEIDFGLPGEPIEGDAWYTKICKFTLANDGWGAYDSGVVSSSGWGDGMYPLYAAEVERKWWQFWKPERQVVAMQLTFIDQSADLEDDWDDDEQED